MLQANNRSELLEILEKIDISVPRRSEGRTKDHTERYAIVHLLSTLAEKGHFSCPLSLAKRERPDFLLTLDSAKIGIEHTEAVPQNEAHKTVLRDRINSPCSYFVPRYQPGAPRKTAKRLKEEIQENSPGVGWKGNSVEEEWANAMFYFVSKKFESLQKQDFKRFDRDWLLIYDNWSLPALDLVKATQFLMKTVSDSYVLTEFEYIFIISGNKICEFSCSGIKLHGLII